MDKRSIPSSRPGSSRTPPLFSRPSKPGCEALINLSRAQGNGGVSSLSRTWNPESRTLNFEPGSSCRRFRCSRFDVQRSRFSLVFPRRVMGAWWPSRSSKPLPRHCVPGGRFDSCPLRHSYLRFLICDCEKQAPGCAPLQSKISNQKSKIP